MSGVLGTLVLVQLTLALGYLATRAMVRAGLSPRELLLAHRGLLLAALALPFLAGSLQVHAPWRAPVQVAHAGDLSGDTVLSVASAAAPATLSLAPRTVELGGLVILVLGLALLLRTLLDAWRLRRLVRTARPWRRVGPVRVRVHPALSAPCAISLPAPVILLDQDTAADAAARYLALRHELQHHRQGDPLWAWAWRGLRGAFGLNPAVRAWARLARELEEQACDAAVVAHPRVSPRAYGRLLLSTALRPMPQVSVAAGLVPRSSLHHRIAMLADPAPRRPLRSGLLALAGLGLLLATSLAGQGLAEDRRVSTAEFQDLVAQAAQAGVDVPDHPVIHGHLGMILTRWAPFYQRGLERRPRYQELVDSALAGADLPPFLAAVPLVESGYSNWGHPDSDEPSSGAPGTIPGRGLWMFIPRTARAYGLQVDEDVDQRFDEVEETRAAVALLADMHARYGDWGLAVAAYNMGPQAVDAAIEAGGSRDPWELTERGLLNEYAAVVMAAALVLEEPSLVR